MRARWPSHMNLFSDLSIFFFLLCVRQRHWYRKTLRQLNTWKYFTLILKGWCWIEGVKRRKIWAFVRHEGEPQHWVTMLDIPLYQALGNRKGRKAKEKSHDGIKYLSHAQRIQTSLGLTLPLNWKQPTYRTSSQCVYRHRYKTLIGSNWDNISIKQNAIRMKLITFTKIIAWNYETILIEKFVIPSISFSSESTPNI